MILKTKDITIKPMTINLDSPNLTTEEIKKKLEEIRQKIEAGLLPLRAGNYKQSETTMLLPGIKNIFYSDKEGKEVVVVLFEDGSKIIKRPCKGDHFDLNVGVSLAIAEKIFSSKTQYHKYIKSKTSTSNKD